MKVNDPIYNDVGQVLCECCPLEEYLSLCEDFLDCPTRSTYEDAVKFAEDNRIV